MAELTTLETKLAEVMGLAQAAKETTSRVGKLVNDSEVKDLLRRMRDEADETAKRCEAVASERDGKKSAIKAKARETKGEAQQMRDAYLGQEFSEGATPEEICARTIGRLREVGVKHIVTPPCGEAGGAGDHRSQHRRRRCATGAPDAVRDADRHPGAGDAAIGELE